MEVSKETQLKKKVKKIFLNTKIVFGIPKMYNNIKLNFPVNPKCPDCK